MDQAREPIPIKTLITTVVCLGVSFVCVNYLFSLLRDDISAFDVSRTGEIPLVQNDAQAVAAQYQKMMPLMPDDGSLVTYVEAVESCNAAYYGSCINVRSGPSTDAPVVFKMRKGTVLRVEKTVRVHNRDWYKITFDEYVRYPERLGPELYVAVNAVQNFTREAPHDADPRMHYDTLKMIIVDISDQKMYAYDDDEVFMEAHVSTGLDDTPTEPGTYRIFRKTPSRYMQGPIPGGTTDEYDLPGVPWTMYFTAEGAAIHGAYWHSDFGNQHSHGCVNLTPEESRILYEWAPLGTPVVVQE